MMIRSVNGFQHCVDWRQQNVAVPFQLEAAYYYVKVKSGFDDPEVVYKNGVRAGVGQYPGEISVSKIWYDKDCYRNGINGPASFKDQRTKEKIIVNAENPLGKDEVGTRFIVDAAAVDMLEHQLFYNITKCGFHFQGILPGYCFVAHEDPASKQIVVHNRPRFTLLGGDRMHSYEDWISKRHYEGKPPKVMDLIFEEYETLPEDADENAKKLEEASGRLYQKDVQCRAWIEGYGSEKKFHENRRPWLCTPDGEVHLYDQNGFEVARMTNEMTDNKLRCGNVSYAETTCKLG